MVLQNQRIVFTSNIFSPTDDVVKVEGSPMKTRSGRTLQKFGHIPKGQWGSGAEHVGGGVDGPQGTRKQPSPTPSQGPACSEDSFTSGSQASSLPWLDEEVPKVDRPGIAGEQVVNTAAICFLQSLFVHDTRNAYWSPHRKGFRFGDTSFKAYTDGHLQIVGDSRSAAIVEVKARERPVMILTDFKIEWQESAQMALWIRTEPSSFWTTKEKPEQCR